MRKFSNHVLIRSYTQVDLEKRIRDNTKRGMVLLSQGASKKNETEYVYWAKFRNDKEYLNE